MNELHDVYMRILELEKRIESLEKTVSKNNQTCINMISDLSGDICEIKADLINEKV
jgi:uncharacterized coiled-coil protein SlyX